MYYVALDDEGKYYLFAYNLPIQEIPIKKKIFASAQDLWDFVEKRLPGRKITCRFYH